MYSLNAPVPAAVATLADELAVRLTGARSRPRGTRTLVVKRLATADPAGYARLEAKARETLAGTAPCKARITSVDLFEAVPSGTAPVVYLHVESPGLEALHDDLCGPFEPVADIEADDYVPHVTIARGGNVETARSVAASDVEPIEWDVDELVFWDATHEQSVSHVSLPA